MNLISPSYQIIEQDTSMLNKMDAGIEHIVAHYRLNLCKHIEYCGRTCYKSEDKITDTSAEPFVERMLNSKHYAMLEHGTIYLMYTWEHDRNKQEFNRLFANYNENPYSKVVTYQTKYTITEYITTNARVLVEKGWLTDLQYVCSPTKFHEKRVTVKFTSDIHFYKDLTRHRVMSWAIESTRFCNYLKAKFGGSISFIEPIWLKDEERAEFIEDLKTVESLYFKWLNKGWQPQQAAYFLIQGTKAECVMTGFLSDYLHLFDLRALGKTGNPHPTVKELIEPLMNEFIEKGLIHRHLDNLYI